MTFKYTFNDPNQVIKMTFPFSGKVIYSICGGGGGGGGPDDIYPAASGSTSDFRKGEFTIPTNNYSIVVHPGGGGKRGGWTGNGEGGGLGGDGILKGGNGGSGGPVGTSGGGGGGGAASFIMAFAEYQELIAENLSNIIPLVVIGGGGGGGGAGRWGGQSTSVSLRQTLSSLLALNGANGQSHPSDGGGGGGGGAGWVTVSNGNALGGGGGGLSGVGDTTGQSGANGRSTVLVSVSSTTRPTELVNAGIGGLAGANGTNGVVVIEYIPDSQDTSDVYVNHKLTQFDPLTFKKVPEIYIRANSNRTWQQVKDVYVKQNGNWVNIFHVVDESAYAPTVVNANSIVKGPLNKGSDLGWVISQGVVPEWSNHSGVLNTYGISKDSVWKLGASEFTTTVYIPSTSNYRLRVASDNTGYAIINCNRGSTNNTFNIAPGYKDFIVNLPKGEVYLKVGYTNNEGPGAIAVILYDLSGNIVWNTRAWQNGTYSFTYNTSQAGVIGVPDCASITDITAEP